MGSSHGVRPAVVGDLRAIAAIHGRAFPASVLAQLGAPAIVRYYHWLLTGPHQAVFLVHEGAHGVDGFIAGGYFQDALGGFVARNKLVLAGRLLVRPRLLVSAVGRRRLAVAARSLVTWARRRVPARREVRRDPGERAPAARLYRCLALAVSPGEQGRGVGQALMAGLTAAAQAAGIPRMQLGVDPRNTRAVRFYELQGWTRMSQYNDWFDAPAHESWWGLMELVVSPSTYARPTEMPDPASPAAEVTIVVVVRDRLSTFPACLDAIYAHTGAHIDPRFQVIVVVGGADMRTRTYLEGVARRRGNLRAIHRGAPLWPSEALGLAIPQVRTRRCVVMENDTVVHAGWLRPLLDCARERGAAVVAPLVLWHRGVHAAGGSFERVHRHEAVALRHAIEYRDVRRKQIGYAETHCMLVDLAQVTAADLCDPVEPSDVDLGLTLAHKGCTAVLEPRSIVTYAAPPPLEVRDLAHSLQRWDLRTWQARNARFVDKWRLAYDASAKHASYRRQAVRLALVRRCPTELAVAVTNLGTRLMNRVATGMTSRRVRRSFG